MSAVRGFASFGTAELVFAVRIPALPIDNARNRNLIHASSAPSASGLVRVLVSRIDAWQVNDLAALGESRYRMPRYARGERVFSSLPTCGFTAKAWPKAFRRTRN